VVCRRTLLYGRFVVRDDNSSRANGPAAASLVIVRHGESEGNAAGRFSGWRDVPLTAAGSAQARAAGEALRDAVGNVDVAFCSRLQRARVTAEQLCHGLGQPELERTSDWRLNERHCGAFQGKTKDAVRDEYGEDALRAFRRKWHVRPSQAQSGSVDDPNADAAYADVAGSLPCGESVADLVVRVQQFYREHVVAHLQAGRCVLVVAHAISLRALAYVLDGADDEALPVLRLGNADARHYRFDVDLNVTQVRAIRTTAG